VNPWAGAELSAGQGRRVLPEGVRHLVQLAHDDGRALRAELRAPFRELIGPLPESEELDQRMDGLLCLHASLALLERENLEGLDEQRLGLGVAPHPVQSTPGVEANLRPSELGGGGAAQVFGREGGVECRQDLAVQLGRLLVAFLGRESPCQHPFRVECLDECLAGARRQLHLPGDDNYTCPS